MNDLLLYHNNWFTCTFSMASSKKMKDAIFFFQKIYQKNLKNHRYMIVLALVLE